MVMEQRKKSLFILYLVNFVANSGYALLQPMFPPLAIRKGVDEAYVGYIFSLYPIGAFFVSFLLGSSLSNATMKKVMLIGISLTIAGMLGFAMLEYINNVQAFVVLSSVARLITGIGATCCFTPSFSLAAYLYYDKVSQVLSYMETVAGVALFSGPLFAGLFQTIGEKTPIGGYQLPFYAFILLYLIAIPFVMFGLKVERESVMVSIIRDMDVDENIPRNKVVQSPEVNLSNDQKNLTDASAQKYKNEVEDLTDSSVRNDLIQKKRHSKQSMISAIIHKLNYFQIFRIKGVIVTYIVFSLFFIASMSMRTYLAIQLQDSYNLSSLESTFVFLVIMTAYFGGAIVAGQIKNLDRKVTISVMLLLAGIQYFFNGPDEYFTGIPHTTWVLITASGVYGITSGTICSIIIAEYMDIIRQVYPKNEEDVNDISSAMYISGWSVGEFLGPIIGGVLVPIYGYDRTGAIMGFGTFGTFIFYTAYVLDHKIRKPRTKLTESVPP